jgi:hypothetical protein
MNSDRVGSTKDEWGSGRPTGVSFLFIANPIGLASGPAYQICSGAGALHADAEPIWPSRLRYLTGLALHLVTQSAAALFQFIQSAPVSAADDSDVYAGPLIGEDLTFPATPEPFGYAKANKMLKLAGTRPFPALVIFPTCGGHGATHCPAHRTLGP